jgi:hypothetical protein
VVFYELFTRRFSQNVRSTGVSVAAMTSMPFSDVP